MMRASEGHVEPYVSEGRLVRVLADWCPPFSGYHLYYPSRRQPSPADAEALDERGVLRPGHTLRWHLTLMDGAPGPLTNDQRRALIDSYNERISNAWRDVASTNEVGAAQLRDEALSTISDPYERYDRRLQDAWR
jgi:hypothetical protein